MADTAKEIVERVVAAAMVYNGVTCSLPAPARHNDIIHAIAQSIPPTLWPVNGETGFLTNTGRFVDRIEAMEIARAAEQTTSAERLLYSEDVW